MKTVLVGDLHGHTYWLPSLRKLHSDAHQIILVGDVGIGFSETADAHLELYAKTIDKPPYFRFIRGNHDNPHKVKEFRHPGFSYIPDGTIEDGIMYVGGAWSIDGVTGAWPNTRVTGVDWWPEEELSREEWDDILRLPNLGSVHTVVSHDCPSEVTTRLLPGRKIYNTRTGEGLSMLWEALPNVKNWYFGHYHVNAEIKLGGVTFRCLNEGTQVAL
ncbi:MAG: metallophosphoesterase [Thiohalomonadaceae bacterium]